MTIHELKTLPEYFLDICTRSKNFELRKNDRNYKVGDCLVLKEFDEIEGVQVAFDLCKCQWIGDA